MVRLPGCLQALEAECPIPASCAAPSVDAGGFVRVCTSGGGQCQSDAGTPVQQQVHKADGSLCYTLTSETSQLAACEHETYTWTDAAGNVVARGNFSAEAITFVLQISCVTDAGSNDSITCNPSSPDLACMEPLGRLGQACPCAAP